MKKVLLLHGWEADSDSNWFPWLEKELKNKGYELIIPDLQNSYTPVLEEQLGYLKYDNYDLIIGHSLGCKLALTYIEKYEIKNTKVILVGPVYPEFKKYDVLVDYCNKKLNIDNIQDNNYIIFLSDNDEIIDIKKAKKYYLYFKNIKIIELHNKHHFDGGNQILKLPEILEYI